MTDSTVSALTAASALDGTELFYSVQGGADRKVTGAQIATFAALGDLTVRTNLTADTTWYVRTNGSDSNTGLVNTAGGAFLTIQKAVDTVCKTIDLAGYVATIQVADGTYAEDILLSDYVGEGGVRTVGPETEDLCVKLIGNETTPTNVILTGAAVSTQFRVLRIANSKEWLVTGFSLAPVNFQDGIEVHYATLRIGVLDFGTATGGYGIWVPSRSTVIIEEGGVISWSGDGWAKFVSLYDGAWMRCWEHTTLNFNSDVAFSIFADVGEGAALHLQRLDALNLNGHTITGWKYFLWNGGSLRVDKNVGGDVNPFDLPGDTPGLVQDFGYYNSVLMHGNRTFTLGPHVVTADYALVYNDADATLYVNSATAKTITLPKTFPQSWRCKVVQEGVGAVNFTAATGATKQGATGLTTQYSAAIVEVKANADDLTADWRIVTEAVGAGSSGLTIGTTSITSGTTARFLYDNGAVVGEALIRYSAANLFLGDADAASPVAQTVSPQNVATGTSNTAGADFTISGSKGTGTGAGGSIVFKTAPLGGSGTSQNALATAFTVSSAGVLNFAQRFALTGPAGSSSYIDFTSNQIRFATTSGAIVCNVTTDVGPPALGFPSTRQIFWTNDPNDPSQSVADTYLTRNAAATLQHGAADAASPVAQTLTVQSTVAGTSDTAGTAWTFVGSKGTGTAASGNIIHNTGFSAKSTGTSQHTTVDRNVIVAKGKVLTDATPVSLFEIALPTLTMCGGTIEATIRCTDGTDMQSFTQTITYSAINKGGVYTKSITASTGDKSVSGGSTIANTWTLLDGTNKVTVQLSSDTSLTPSSNAFLCYYSVKNNSEQATTIL